MPKSHRPYAPEFRRQMVDLVRSGRSPEALSRGFEPTAQAIWNWVRQADRDEGRCQDGATSAAREELTRPPTAPTSFESPTSPMSRRRPASCISLSCSMRSAVGSSAGRWRRICGPSWS